MSAGLAAKGLAAVVSASRIRTPRSPSPTRPIAACTAVRACAPPVAEIDERGHRIFVRDWRRCGRFRGRRYRPDINRPPIDQLGHGRADAGVLGLRICAEDRHRFGFRSERRRWRRSSFNWRGRWCGGRRRRCGCRRGFRRCRATPAQQVADPADPSMQDGISRGAKGDIAERLAQTVIRGFLAAETVFERGHGPLCQRPTGCASTKPGRCAAEDTSAKPRQQRFLAYPRYKGGSGA